MFEKTIAVGTIVLASAVVVSTGVVVSSVRKLTKRFDKSASELAKASEETITESMIENAVNDAAKRKVKNYIDKVGDIVLSEEKKQISDSVRKAVILAKAEVDNKVSERIASEAALIDLDDLKKQVRAKAEEKVLSKFDGNLDELLGKFNENLSNVQKIYNGIAEAMGKKDSSKEIKLSL